MKKILFLLVACFLVANSFGQSVEKYLTGNNDSPKFIKFNTSEKASSKDPKAVLKQFVYTQAHDEIVEIRTTNDANGFSHSKFQQYYKGIKVEHGVFTVNSKNNILQSANGEYIDMEAGTNTTAKLSERNALSSALKHVGAKKYMWEDKENQIWAKSHEKSGSFYPSAELVFVRNYRASEKMEKNTPRLAYKFNIYAQEPLSRGFIYVDAENGKILHTNAIIKQCFDHSHNHAAEKVHNHHNTNEAETTAKFESALANATATAATRYSGTKSIQTDSYNGSYRLRETTRGNGIETYDMNTGTNYNSAVDFTDNDNNWTAAEFDNTAKDNVALDAHWGAEMTYDYWITKHNRNSFDGNGAAIKSYVHFDDAYDNAYWNGSVMTYGDGSDTYFDALAALDVTAHEIGHAVCSYTADLNYENEPGAMNEGFSDIWGACVEYFAAPEKDTWLIGEDIERRTGHDALRSMSNPKAEGQPDTYFGTNWAALSTNPTQTNDYGGVHTNSGVLNHWFYILAVGKSSTNDNGDSYSVTGISIDKAANIAYRLESVYLTSTSSHADARTFSIQAAEDLYGAASNEVIQTTNAWYAVGVGAEYGSIAYCTSKGGDASYEWISNVTIGSFSNTSGSAGYTNFTSQTIDLTAGDSYAITLTPSFKSSTYDEYWKIWIDYNKDGDFSDANELVFDAGAMSKTAVSGTITIANVAAITTRMRVSMKYNGAQTECESFSYGEVEDYTVNISDGGSVDTQAPTTPSNLSASSISQTSLTLSWSASTDNVGVTAYDVYKNGSLLTTVTGTSTPVSSLSASTTYSFYVKAKDAAGNISAQSSTKNVTTLSIPDTQAPTIPANLSASNITETSVDLNWSASTDNTGVTAYEVYKNGILYTSVSTTSASITGLTSATAYNFYVKAKDAEGNISSASSTVTATTLEAQTSGEMPTGYCSTKGNNATYEWIDLVRLGSIDNTSSKNNGYADFTSMSTNVALGSSQTIYISAGFKSSSYTEYWHVWIDYNRDGDFDDSGEEVINGSSSSSNELSATFTVPTTASLGTTRMRVTMKYNAAATPCETFSYGEVEDYAVNITSTSFAFANENSKSFSADLLGHEEASFGVYPIPTSDFLTIKFTEVRNLKISIFNTIGALVKSENIDNNKVDVSELKSGVYMMSINDGNKTTYTKFIKK